MKIIVVNKKEKSAYMTFVSGLNAFKCNHPRARHGAKRKQTRVLAALPHVTFFTTAKQETLFSSSCGVTGKKEWEREKLPPSSKSPMIKWSPQKVSSQQLGHESTLLRYCGERSGKLASSPKCLPTFTVGLQTHLSVYLLPACFYFFQGE